MLVLFTFFSSALRHLQEYIFWDENRQWFCLLACNFSTSKHYQSSCWSRWENLDHGQYQFQPIKFVNLVVPSPYETEPYNKCIYYLTNILMRYVCVMWTFKSVQFNFRICWNSRPTWCLIHEFTSLWLHMHLSSLLRRPTMSNSVWLRSPMLALNQQTRW